MLKTELCQLVDDLKAQLRQTQAEAAVKTAALEAWSRYMANFHLAEHHFADQCRLLTAQALAQPSAAAAKIERLVEALKAARHYLPGVGGANQIGACKNCGKPLAQATNIYCPRCVSRMVEQALAQMEGFEAVDK